MSPSLPRLRPWRLGRTRQLRSRRRAASCGRSRPSRRRTCAGTPTSTPRWRRSSSATGPCAGTAPASRRSARRSSSHPSVNVSVESGDRPRFGFATARRPRARGRHAPVRRRPRRRRPGDARRSSAPAASGPSPACCRPATASRCCAASWASTPTGSAPPCSPRTTTPTGRRSSTPPSPRSRPSRTRRTWTCSPSSTAMIDDRSLVRVDQVAALGRDEHPVAATGVRHVRRRQPEGGARAVPAAGRRGADRRRGGRRPGRPGRRPGLVRPGALQPRLPVRRRHHSLGVPAAGAARLPSPQPGPDHRDDGDHQHGHRDRARRPPRRRTPAATPPRCPGRRPR